MNSQATSNEGDSLISDPSDEAPSYSTFPTTQHNQQPNEVIKERKKSSMEFPLVVKTRSNIQKLKWVRKTFQKKYCMKYVPSDADDERCHCGRTRKEHSQCAVRSNSIDGVHIEGNADESEETKWNPRKHLGKKETNAYGDVIFDVAGKQSKAKYIRFAPETDVEDAMALLFQQWKLPVPEILMCIIGDDKITESNPKLAAVLSEGFTQVVNSTGAWITTQGIDTGVFRFFNEKTVCIGITCWGNVYNRNKLTKIGETVDYHPFNRFISENTEDIGMNLEKSHSHFLLVDDGYVNKCAGGEMEFRSKIEDALRTCAIKEKVRYGVPSIRIMLGGGPDTIDFMLAELKKENPLPVVIIRGSGKAADILSYAYSIHPVGKPLHEVDDMHGYEILRQLIEEKFPFLSGDEIGNVFKNVIQCVNFQEHIFIYGMQEKSENKCLDQVMLEGLLQDRNLSQNGQLKLAMLFNRVDIARNKIFIEGAKQGLLWTENEMRTFLFKALVNNKPDFVDLFLEIGLPISSVIADGKFILNLHKEGLKKNNSFLKVFKKEKKVRQLDLELLESLYEDCSGRGVRQLKLGSFHELFIWAVINNLPDMMHLLWSRGEDSLRKALIGECTSKLMIKIAEKHKMLDDVISEYRSNEKQFHELGLRLLNECHNDDEALTRQLLQYDCYLDENAHTLLRPVRTLRIAADIGNEEFVAHSSCQYLLNLEWGGALEFQEDGRFKHFFIFVLCLIMPPLILLQRFRSEKNETEEDDEETDKEDLDANNEGRYSVKTRTGRTWKSKFRAFFDAPMTKFHVNVVSYAFFLGLFTFVITNKLQKNPDPWEWLLIIWVVALALEEWYQMRFDGFKKWLSSYWNVGDAVAIVLFFVGFGLRMGGLLIEGRITYALDLMVFILRILEIFYVDRTLGPYVVMIGRMTKDLMNFITIALVFMFAYGIGRDVILNPDTDRSFSTFAGRLLVPYFEMYGELFIEYPQQNTNETIFSSRNYNVSVQPLVICMMAFYLLVANVLLLNILIAVFNNTYAEVQQKADTIWKFQRYQLIRDYERRLSLPPPLSLILNVWGLLYSIFIYICKCVQLYDKLWKSEIFSKPRRKGKCQHLLLFEQRCLENVLLTKYANLRRTVEEEVAMISDRTTSHSEALLEISASSAYNRRQILANREAIYDVQESIKTLENNLKNITSLLNEVIENQIGNKRHLSYRPTSPLFDKVGQERGYNEPLILSRHRHSIESTETEEDHRSLGTSSDKQHSVKHEFKTEIHEVLPVCGGEATKTVEVLRIDEGRKDSTILVPDKNIVKTCTENKEYEANQPSEVITRSLISSPTTLPNEKRAALHQPNIDSGTYADEDEDINLEPPRRRTKSDSSDSITSVGESLPSGGKEYQNTLSKSPVYPMSSMQRSSVPDDMVSWQVNMPVYDPPAYTCPVIAASSKWTDEEILHYGTRFPFKFNDVDGDIDRRSYLGLYEIINGIPRNPVGRTGLTGRGILGRYGPNQMCAAIFTRTQSNGGKTHVEALVMPRRNNKGLTFPQGAKLKGSVLPEFVSKLFSKETLLDIGMNKRQSEIYTKKFDKLIMNKVKIFEGYLDDERNTDNAWLEIVVYNYHDEENIAYKYLMSKENHNLHWRKISHIDKFGSTTGLQKQVKDWLEKVSSMRQ